MSHHSLIITKDRICNDVTDMHYFNSGLQFYTQTKVSTNKNILQTLFLTTGLDDNKSVEISGCYWEPCQR